MHQITLFQDKSSKIFREGAQPPPQAPPPVGRGTPPHHTHTPRRLRCLDPRAYGARYSPPPLSKILDPPLIAMTFDVDKLKWLGYPIVKNFEDMITRFDRMYERDTGTDRRRITA